MELPPRARRIRYRGQVHVVRNGTTSACAENTAPPHRENPPLWNYLRVRGEYSTLVHDVGDHRELPPRARRIHSIQLFTIFHSGTTSACAENTSDGKTFPMIFWNYLRVRGEYCPLLCLMRWG